MNEVRIPARKKLTKPQREMLRSFKTATVERREPTPKTISDAITNGLLEIVGYDENNFMILKLTAKGDERLNEN